jgi:hypothetical protein
MKRRVPLGFIKTPLGNVPVKNAAVARTLEQQQAQLAECGRHLKQTRTNWQEAIRDLHATRLQLAALQNHWWTRLGEAMGVKKRTA